MRGISTNVASFVSAATVRAHEVGYDNRPPTAAELERMRAHVRRAMDEGAMGLTTALIYIPGVFARTDELVELAKVARERDFLPPEASIRFSFAISPDSPGRAATL